MNKIKSYLVPILTLAVISLGLLGALGLSRQRQEIRKEAAVSGGGGKITLNPSSAIKYPGQTFPVNINFRTGTTDANAVAVSSVSLRISYSYSGATPELDIIDVIPNLNLLNTGDWSFPVKTVTRASGKVILDLAAINTSFTGYKSSTDTPLATFNLIVNRIPTTNPITLSFDLSLSKMMTKADPPTDILENPANVSYTVQADTLAPANITNLATGSPTKQSLVISWTAPSDTGPEGKAASYDLRYSTSLINDSNWASATQITGLPTPASPGTTQSFTISSLSSGTTYYFAIKSADAAGNTSGLSNIPSGITSSATLSFGFKFQGIGTSGITKSVEVTLKGTLIKTYSSVSFRSDASGIFSPVSPLPLTDFPIPTAGISVDVLVKDENHLRRKLGSLTLTPTDNSGPVAWNLIILKAGDFNNDNVLNITDISNLLTVYNALSVPVIAGNRIYDANSDNTINIDDISLVLSNYTALQIPGE
jgi:hypothetical protein